MDFITALLIKSLVQVWGTFVHNWPFLIVSILLAAVLKIALNPEKISAFLQRYSKAGVVGATAVAVATPLCSCGTMAIILGMMANTMPWAPIIAFMVASPLTSPQELIYSAGLFGWPFAIAFYFSSILLGLAGGMIASFMESRGWLKNQSRFTVPKTPTEETCGCGSTIVDPVKTLSARREKGYGGASSSPFIPLEVSPSAVAAGCGCGAVAIVQPIQEPTVFACSESTQRFAILAPIFGISNQTWKNMAGEMWNVSRLLIPMFFIFAFIGYVLNGLIPTAWVSAIFGKGNIYSVPLAATLGLPLYINTEASLPLVRALLEGGMSQGSALAFLITGAGTSIGAFSGALTIARWRVIGVVIGTLWSGSVIIGVLYNFLLTLQLF